MLFYDCATAPSPRRARMFIAEKGLEIPTREISISKHQQLSPEFLSVNPRGTVPVLVTAQGNALTENLAIATYLEAMYPQPPLMGVTADEKADIMMWTAIAEAQCGLPIAEALRNSNPHMKGRAIPGTTNFDQIPELAQRGMQRLGLFFDMLETHLQNRTYVATNQFTLADITAFVFVDFARVVKYRVEDTHPNLKRWYAHIKARPSASL